MLRGVLFQNILIADDGTPRICDFEMSKNLDTISVSIAAGGGGFTPGFMCPQVLSGRVKLSSAADMYAFGVVILNTIHPPGERLIVLALLGQNFVCA